MASACDLTALSSSSVSTTTGGCTLKLPPDGASMSPWVQVTFEISGVQITVGNQSSPQNDNTAVIKDFEFGGERGFECRVTIIDEEGSSFVGVMVDLLKDSACATPTAISMVLNFGWVMDSCPSAVSVIKNVEPYYLVCENIECNFVGGVFLFQIIGKDIGSKMNDFRDELPLGTDQNEMFLTDAITQLLTTGTPRVSSVKFQRYDDDNNIQPIVWDDGSLTGRKSVWRPNSIDKLNAVLDWLSQNTTINGKTVLPAANIEVQGGEIIFWEDYRPNCGETRDWDMNCIGTFVVNGGKMSNVLEFNPKIRWTFLGMTSPGGGMGQGQVMANQNGGANPGRIGCPTLSRASLPTTGSNNTVPVNPDNFEVNIANSAQIAQAGHDAQQKGFGLNVENIEADLVIMGDPTLIRPSFAVLGRNAKIVFINPFYISSGTGCGDWLASPLCNPVLTNKAWLTKSMIHRISGGKFTTTIRLFLTAPGVDIDIGQPLGGPGSGGWVPPSNC